VSLYERATGVVCFSFFFWLCVLDKAEYSAFESTLNSAIVSYRMNLLAVTECFTVSEQQQDVGVYGVVV